MEHPLQRCWLYLLSSLALCITFYQPAAAQATYQEPLINQAIAAIQRGVTDPAIDSLAVYVAASPGAASAIHGPLSYWLGKAHLDAGQPDEAINIWRSGILAMNDADSFDHRLGLTFLNAVFAYGSSQHYALGTAVYERLLADVGRPVSSLFQTAFTPYLEAIAFILPTAQREAWQLDNGWQASAATAANLWWRSKDPAPATRNNELLEEHLERVAYAMANYRFRDQFDDRGAVYIRLGPPTRTTSIQFDKSNFRNKVLDQNLTITESDFPGNEFWFYAHIDNAAQFLFHDTSGLYRLGQTRNLLPSSLRSGLGNSTRGKAKARAMVRTLEEIYKQLSLYHPTFATRYTDVAAFSSLLDDADIASQLNAAQQSEDESVESLGNALNADLLANSRASGIADAGMPGSAFNPNRPDLFVNHTMAAYKVEDDMLAVQREDYVPQVRTNVFDAIAPLPLYFRTARFLEEDGTTRTEIYWRPAANALALDNTSQDKVELAGITPDDYLIVTSVVQKTPDYLDRQIAHDRAMLPGIATGLDVSLPTQTVSTTGDLGLYHLALQIDMYAANIEDGQLRKIGPHVKANTYQQDSLNALPSDTGTLTMSDLKPMILPASIQEMPDIDEEIIQLSLVDPSPVIDGQTPLVLYFEVYNLQNNASGRTQFDVKYEINSPKRRGLFRKAGTDKTTFTSTIEGNTAKSEEFLVLDLSDQRKAGPLNITVEIFDHTTQQTVSRQIAYEIKP
ncbi:MAG: GWxTD domain-containing protein [Bacteroidota bacterium]